MSNLNPKTVSAIEILFNMSTGYVLDFNNNSFKDFIFQSIGIDIYNDSGYQEYSSKANKLRQIIKNEDNNIVSKLISDLIDYFNDYNYKNGNSLNDYQKRKIDEIKNEINRFSSESNLHLDVDLQEKIQMISTRNARFSEMKSDEKIKEIANLIENLLKKNGKYISIDFELISMGYITTAIVKEYRSKIQCFRHSTDEALSERISFTEKNKNFIIDFGVLICNIIINN